MAFVSGLDHFTIHPSRLDDTVAFFEDVLHLENRPEDRPDFGFPGAWLFLGSRPLVHLLEIEDDPQGKNGAFDHVAFTADDFDGLVAHLGSLDVKHRLSEQPDTGLRQIFMREPNGVMLEITGRT